MGEQIIAYGKAYFYFIMIAVGIIVVVGCIFNWQWIIRIGSPSKLPLIRAFIEEVYGIEGRYKFERFVNFLCGVLLIILGLAYWHFYG